MQEREKKKMKVQSCNSKGTPWIAQLIEHLTRDSGDQG